MQNVQMQQTLLYNSSYGALPSQAAGERIGEPRRMEAYSISPKQAMIENGTALERARIVPGKR